MDAIAPGGRLITRGSFSNVLDRAGKACENYNDLVAESSSSINGIDQLVAANDAASQNPQHLLPRNAQKIDEPCWRRKFCAPVAPAISPFGPGQLAQTTTKTNVIKLQLRLGPERGKLRAE